MDVSVIIVNFNTQLLTKQCVDSIYAHTEGVEFEVIVVDNASTDGSTEMFEHDDRITLIKNTNNQGFGSANNIGITRATGKYLFFLNSDTFFLNNAIKEFYDFAEKHIDDKIGAIGCLLRKRDGSYCHSYASFPSVIEEIFKPIVLPLSRQIGRPWQYLDKPPFKEPVMPVGYVTGADLFVKRTLIDEYGSFDPDFFMYYEETEMQFRWRRKGFVSYIISTPQIVHLEGGSSCLRKEERRNVGKELVVTRSLFLYMKKTLSSSKYCLFRLGFATAKLPFLFFSSISWRDRKAYATLIGGHNIQ